ncbi:YhcN/YlaJ family sporulation lipoprotein [Bacillus sp. JCM 19034]|uniref:YhcN/YlaJ family sporulation lipoprotein n=1 Tax=Bacillus sp. JCM 19034 TaxID=1481928 RepID=UPI00078560E3|nr:YhcN/YlaJ family sporulation lipoprotein [Bacillus sp. JCM 19034]
MKKIFIIIIIMIGLVGCQMNAQHDVKVLQLDDAIVEQTQANKAKEIVLSMEEVTEVRGVSYDNSIYIATHVKPFDRFFLNEIRKKAHDNVKKRYPEATVHVTTDEKIFIELEKIEQQLKKQAISEERLSKRLKELDEMMKG